MRKRHQNLAKIKQPSLETNDYDPTPAPATPFPYTLLNSPEKQLYK